MNLGICETSSSRKNAQTSSPSSIPLSSLSKFASRMGFDISEFGDQAESMWATLNDLYESDPESYQSFLKEQMRMIIPPNSGETDPGGSKKPFFTPRKGFAVELSVNNAKENKSRNRTIHKLFVNFCQHEAIQIPLDCAGKPISSKKLKRDSKLLENLQVPLVVSDRIMTTTKTKESSVDVVFHPWCIERAYKNNCFKSQLIQLGLTWVKKEHQGIEFNVNYGWALVKPSYKSCAKEYPINDSAGIDDVNPFYFDPNMMKQQVKEETDCNDKSKGVKEKKSITVTTPKEIIQTMANREENVASSSLAQGELSLDSFKTTISKSKPLIQDITKEENTASQENLKPARDKNREKATRKNVPLKKSMKGFLLDKKKEGVCLYPERSSGDGLDGTGGTYVKFLSKCNIVDTSSSRHSKAVASQQDDNDNNNHNSMSTKGFLNKSKSSSSNNALEDGTFENELREMLEAEEPCYNLKETSRDNEKESSLMTDGIFKKELENLLKEEEDNELHNQRDSKISTKLSEDPHTINDDNVTIIPILSNTAKAIELNYVDMNAFFCDEDTEKLTDHQKNKSSSSTLKQSQNSSSEVEDGCYGSHNVEPAKLLPFCVKTKRKKIVVNVDFSRVSRHLRISSIDLQTSSSTLKLKTSCGRSMEYRFETSVDASRVSARLVVPSKENEAVNKTLKVVCPILTTNGN